MNRTRIFRLTFAAAALGLFVLGTSTASATRRANGITRSLNIFGETSGPVL